MRRIRILLLVGGLAGALAIADSRLASAHWEFTNNDWYFEGRSRSLDDNQLSDPVNFMVMPGPADPSDYTRARIETHMDDDWDIHAIGGRTWRRDAENNWFCKEDQRMRWFNHAGPSNDSSDKSDWHGTTQRLNYCGNQHHARFWDDLEHNRDTSGHGGRHKWALGSIHHEKVIAVRHWVPGPLPDYTTFTHKIDRDWDVVRRELVKAMHAHCAIPAWEYHEGALMSPQQGQGHDNMGLIARLSLHHVSDGGCAGHL